MIQSVNKVSKAR